MAVISPTISTSSSDVNVLWRKVQGDLADGMNFLSEEWAMMEAFVPKKYQIDVSAREITVPIDLTEDYGVADIPEGGYEARTSSPNPLEITLGYQLMNARFSASVTARILDEKHRGAELRRQIVYQGMKKMQALAAHWSNAVYGTSTGVLAVTDTNLTAGPDTMTLKNLFEDTNLPGTTTAQGTYIANLLKVGDIVAAIKTSSLVASAIGAVTAIASQSSPTITVTWELGSPSDTTDGLKIVKANSTEGTTIAATSFNRGLVGWQDVLKSTTVHGLSGSTYPNWTTASADTAGGRLTAVRLRKLRDEVANKGPRKADRVIWSQGVARDVIDLERAALRYDDPFGLELDGEVKAKGLNFFTSRRVLPGHCIVYDSQSYRRLDVMPKPDGTFAWGDAHKMENRSGYLFPIDFIAGMVCLARKGTAYASGLTEQ